MKSVMVQTVILKMFKAMMLLIVLVMFVVLVALFRLIQRISALVLYQLNVRFNPKAHICTDEYVVVNVKLHVALAVTTQPVVSHVMMMLILPALFWTT